MQLDSDYFLPNRTFRLFMMTNARIRTRATQTPTTRMQTSTSGKIFKSAINHCESQYFFCVSVHNQRSFEISSLGKKRSERTTIRGTWVTFVPVWLLFRKEETQPRGPPSTVASSFARVAVGPSSNSRLASSYTTKEIPS